MFGDGKKQMQFYEVNNSAKMRVEAIFAGKDV
jgi:hypothetical protein